VRGYTLIEVMMAIALLAIGATGIFSLQAVAVHANEFARDTTEAVTVDRFWVEQLRRDSLLWDGAQSAPAALAQTQYLKLAPAASNVVGTWFTPAMPTDGLLGGGAAQQPIGRGLNVTPAAGQGRYCAQMRLSWLRMNRLIRAEVRVWNFKAGGDRRLYKNCGSGSEVPMQSDTENVQWTYLVTTLGPPS